MRYRAVILDDNASIRKLLWGLFDGRDYEVFTFPDLGLCPLHVLHKCPCTGSTTCADIILSDVNMLDGNGIDFLERLIQKGCKQPHFALMSGNFTDADLARAAQLNCTLFGKPLDLARLTVWVEQVEASIPTARILFDWTGSLSI